MHRKKSLGLRIAEFLPAFFLFVGVHAFGATVSSQDAVDEVFFEKEMEARLSRDIAAYLGHDQFIVGVDFKVSGPSGPGGEDNVIVREITTPLPGLPKASETFVKELKPEELEELRENLQLDEQVGSRAGLIDGLSSNAFTGSGTEVYLVLDAGVSSVQETFIRDLITRKLSLDVGGGDGIQVVRSDFSSGVSPAQPAQSQPQQQQPSFQQPFFQPIPQQQPAAPVQQQPAEETETPEERQERLAEEIRKAADEIVQQQANEASAAAAGADEGFLDKYWWLLLVFGLLFLLLFVLILFLAMRRAPSYPQMPYMPAPAPAAVPGAAAATPATAEAAPEARRSTPFADVRREIATVGLSSPHAVRSEMDSLMAQNRVDIIAPAYRVLGHNLFESLFGELPVDKQKEFNEYITERDMSDSQIEAQARDLYTRLLGSANEDTDGSRSQAFRFLEKLHVSQILSLIKKEKTRVQALVISQLKGPKASQILKVLDDKTRSEVLHELSEFESFPLETFRDVASGLARKVQDIPAIENVATDGVVILMGMLDNMNTVDESKILGELENRNPDLYLKLKKQYFTFNDLARAPQKVVGEALLDVDKEVVAGALTGANDSVVRRVMGSLPKRLADAVKSEMELLRGKINSEQIQANRKTILNVMRSLVREGKIDMEKL